MFDGNLELKVLDSVEAYAVGHNGNSKMQDIGVLFWQYYLCKLSSVFPMKVRYRKNLKFGTPQTIAIIVLKIEKFDVTLH